MSKYLILLISFVLVLGLAGSAWAYPLDEAVGVWHLADDNDAAGPPFTNLSTSERYVDFVDVTGTGIDGAVDFDGWAIPSEGDLGASYTELESPVGDELKIDGAVSILARVKMADWAGGIEVVTGLYDGGCGDTVPSYGIEFQDFNHPTFAVTGAGRRVRVEAKLPQAVDVDTWYDILGIFDPDGAQISVTVFDSATGSKIGSAVNDVNFTSLDYPDLPELELFVSPCLELELPINTAFLELVAIWPKVVEIATQVSNPSPSGQHVVPDTELCFQAPAAALCLWVDDPNDPNDKPPDPNLKGPFVYDVYFGADPCTMVQIADACVPANCNDVMCFDPCGGDLNLGTWYYWRVDINDLNEPGDPCFYEGPVFRFRTWGLAYGPEPAHGATDVYPPVLMKWTVDGYAASSDVYFGTDATAVADANTNSTLFKGNQLITDVNYITGMIDLGKSFYWRIDEVNSATVKGDIWSFRTGDHYVVENFDSYVLTEPDLTDVWDDYWVNDTGAEIVIVTDANFVRDGHSISFTYDNTPSEKGKEVGSRIDADIVDLPIGPDWTTSGVKALVLYFYGDPLNSATINDRMYVKLEDTSSIAGVSIYDRDDPDGDPNNVKLTQWTEWNIDMAIFDACGVSLANIDKIHIGFGDFYATGQAADGGTGTVYFDDVGIYARRCVPVVSYPLGDISADCNVNFYDVQAMGADWVTTDAEVPPEDPCDADLVVLYTYDTDYSDTSGAPYYHGQASPSGSGVSGGVLSLDGVGYVTIPFGAANPFGGTQDFSIAMWFKTSADALLISSSEPNDTSGCDMSMNVYTGEIYNAGEVVYDNVNVGWMGTGAGLGDGQWHHIAVTYNAATLQHHIYADGVPESWAEGGDPVADSWDPNITDIAIHTVRIGFTYCDDALASTGPFVGDINEVRIYDVALTHSIVLALAGSTQKVYFPNSSLANLVPKDPNLSPDPNLKYDAYDPNNPDIVNFFDYEVLANHWLEGPLLWP